MWVWYNDRLLQEKDLILHTSNRAFQYGDGIFETLIIENGELLHAKFHKTRILRSIHVMQLNFKLNFEEFLIRLNFLIKKNKLKDGRAKLIIWRAPGGYYVPEKSESEFLITLNKFKKPSYHPQKVGISKEIAVPNGLTQNCKTLNALPYVLAGLELKKYAEYEDLILLDMNGYISECISSNLFWVKDDKYYTPSLESSCVMGVKRSYIMAALRDKKIEVNEVMVTVDELEKADYVFKTNVTGIYPIKSINGKEFEIAPQLQNII